MPSPAEMRFAIVLALLQGENASHGNVEDRASALMRYIEEGPRPVKILPALARSVPIAVGAGGGGGGASAGAGGVLGVMAGGGGVGGACPGQDGISALARAGRGGPANSPSGLSPMGDGPMPHGVVG
jgi:hypothetical protein